VEHFANFVITEQDLSLGIFRYASEKEVKKRSKGGFTANPLHRFRTVVGIPALPADSGHCVRSYVYHHPNSMVN
jgi:hypothetical protein